MLVVPEDAPPFITFLNPYGGISLKTKTYSKAAARIDGLLAASAEVEPYTAMLEVYEPCGGGLTEALQEPRVLPNVPAQGSGCRSDLAAVVTAVGHTLDPLASEAWSAFGPPNCFGLRPVEDGTDMRWSWYFDRRPAEVVAWLPKWSPFVARHQHLVRNDGASRVGVRAFWSLRLRSASGQIVAPPFPRSQIQGHLQGRSSRAILDLVFGHDAVTAAFVEDYRAVCRALGNLTLRPGNFALCTPAKRGSGRDYHKLPQF